MISSDDVKKLAHLSRLALSDEEVARFTRDIDAVLGYVGQITKVANRGKKNEKPLVRNVLREDRDPHESGIYTEALLAGAPEREGDSLKVKKILSHD